MTISARHRILASDNWEFLLSFIAELVLGLDLVPFWTLLSTVHGEFLGTLGSLTTHGGSRTLGGTTLLLVF